jgi:hypothetical protein
MNIEGTHEDSHHDLGGVQMLSHNILDTSCQPLFYYNYVFLGLDTLDIDNGSIGRTDDVFALRNGSRRVPEEPNVAPEKKGGDEDQGANPKDSGQ